MTIDPSTTKYMINAKISAEGVVEKPDVVGAIFGQTDGLIGDELDLRELQKTGRMGRIEVEMHSEKGRSKGTITLPSSLDQVETAILASALETIDRVGPCKATISITSVKDVRAEKKTRIIDRAKVLLKEMMKDSRHSSADLTETVRQAVQIEEITLYGADKCPGGPNVETSDAVIVVEGRSDVLNLLKYGIKNAIAVGGTNIPPTVRELTKERIVTAFTDGDRGGELILKELLQVAELDFIARAPRAKEVEELTQKQIIKALRNKVPAEQFIEMYPVGAYKNGKSMKNRDTPSPQQSSPRHKHPKKSTPVKREPPRSDRPRPGTSNLSKEHQTFKTILNDLSGKLKAKLLDKTGKEILEVQVKELASTLKGKGKGVNTVVFDGVITPRLLEIASSNKIANLVGVKRGANVDKKSGDVTVLTKKDLP